MKTERLGFGIIGCGNILEKHGMSINENERAELIAVCDIIEDRAKDAKEKYGAKEYYLDYMDLLSNKDIDVVCICTPSGMHKDMVVAAANAGKHVFCEKPIDIKLDKIDKMIQACKNNDVKLGCVFQMRTMEQSKIVKNAIEKNELGKLVLVDASLKYFRNQEYYDSGDWRGTWDLDGGGAFMNQGVHGTDLLLWLAGDVESVYSKAAAVARNIEVEDTAVVVMQFKNGAFGSIRCATTVYPGQESIFEIHGEKGSIIFDVGKGFRCWKTIGDKQDRSPEVDNASSGGANDPKAISGLGHYILIDDMISAVLENKTPMISGESARKAVELILAIYESAKTNKEVFLSKE